MNNGNSVIEETPEIQPHQYGLLAGFERYLRWILFMMAVRTALTLVLCAAVVVVLLRMR